MFTDSHQNPLSDFKPPQYTLNDCAKGLTKFDLCSLASADHGPELSVVALTDGRRPYPSLADCSDATEGLPAPSRDRRKRIQSWIPVF